MVRLRLFLTVLTVLIGGCLPRMSSAEPYIPDSLKPWVQWVREQSPNRECALERGGTRVCTFLSELGLDAQKDGARFSLEVDQLSAGEVALPGGGQRAEEKVWPENVEGQNGRLPVFSADGHPAVWLPAGRSTLHGSFSWQSIPKYITVPPSIGLVRLKIGGSVVSSPKFSGSELWLGDTSDTPAESDSLRTQVLRQLDDGSPARLRTRLRFEIGGRARTENLGMVLPRQAVAYSISSDLGYQFSGENGLTVQLRPGVHTLSIESIFPNRLEEYVRPAPAAADWPEEEYVAFVADESFRHVQPEGGAQIDRSQIPFSDIAPDMIPANASIFLLKGSEKITFKTLPREEEAKAPNVINVRREIVLDLEGKGATVQDHISGTMNQRFRLNMLQPAELGAVRQNGTEQLISIDPDSKLRGVELRDRQINIESDARIGSFSDEFSAIGWDTKVDSLSISLGLPPGYALFAAFGVDDPPANGWLHSWTLFEIFLVFLVTVAVLKMFGMRAGGIALAALVLTHNEADAPGSIWLILLCLAALLKVIPQGSGLRKFTAFMRVLFLVCLGFQLFAFTFGELKSSLYPELTVGYFGSEPVNSYPVQMQVAAANAPVSPMDELEESRAGGMGGKKGLGQGYITESLGRASSLPQRMEKAKMSQALRIDPKAAVQAGPGVPHWSGNVSTLGWRGPVRMDESVRIWLLTPKMNVVLGFLRILFVLLLAQIFVPLSRGAVTSGLRTVGLALALLTIFSARPAAADNFPPDTLLKQLSERLTRDECRGECAVVQSMKIKESGESLRFELLVGSRGRSALSLPGPISELPIDSVSLTRGNGTQPVSLRREATGFLQARLEDGVYELVITTPPLQRSSISLQFPSLPGTVTTELTHWAIDGLAPNGGVSGSLRLTRLGAKTGDKTFAQNDSETLPEYFIVERALSLAFPWEIETRISRLGAAERSTSVRVPLLEGERLTDKAFREENGDVLVQIPRGSNEAVFESSLSEREKLHLVANKAGNSSEVWRIDCSPVFRCELDSGIQPIASMNAVRQEFLFQPFPGEEASLKIARPPGAPGQTAAIDSAEVDYELGNRIVVSKVRFELRSTQGGTQMLVLPEQAALRTLTINGQEKNLRPAGRELYLPMTIGKQSVYLEWEQPWEFGFTSVLPKFQLGMPGVNLRESVTVPQERWVLFSSGPGVGSVVFFWPKLLFVVLCALLLGRLSMLHLSTVSWLLLGTGLLPLESGTLVVPIIWFGLHALRRKRPPQRRLWFNFLQLALVFFTFAFLGTLYTAVEGGLLDVPNMRVANPAGLYGQFSWYLDRFPLELPTPKLWSVSLPWVYRPLMFLWAGWLVFSLIDWLKWAWICFSTDGLWKKKPPKPPAVPAEPKPL